MTNSNGMNPKSKISFADFQKVEITVGKILSTEKVPETDKLLKLSVDFGSPLESLDSRRRGVPNSDSGRVVTTPGLADSATPLLEQPPKAAPFVKGDEVHP